MKKRVLRLISLLLAGTTVFLTACQHGTDEPTNGETTSDSSVLDMTDSGGTDGSTDGSDSSGNQTESFYFPEYEPDPAPTEKITVSPKRIASGKSSSFRVALDEEGKLFCWGENDYGQVGNGEQSGDPTAYTPQEVQINTRFVSVSAGARHSLAIDEHGTLWGWGKLEDPEEGENNPFEGVKTPKQLMIGKKYVYAEAGSECSFAIDTEGKLWAWGLNREGQLGDGKTTSSNEAIHVVPKKNFSSVSSYSSVTYAIDTDGYLWGWGDSYKYGMGDGTTDRKLTPRAIMPEKKFVQVTTNGTKAYAIDEEGNLWGWGSNSNGQLGDGTQEKQLTPVPIMQGKYFTYVETTSSETYAIDVQGDLWVWGSESNVLNIKYYPQKVEASVKFLQVSEGLALDENEELWTWGNNVNGEVGDGLTQNILSPTQVFEDKRFSKVVSYSGTVYSIATAMIDMDGGLWWQSRREGFGTENLVKHIMPDKKFKDVSIGGWHILALDIDGKLWAWGRNEDGQLGDGTQENRREPVPIMQDVTFIQVEAGSNFSFAIDAHRNLWAWGGNGDAEISGGAQGLGKVYRQLTPAQVMRGKKFVQVRSFANVGGYAIDTDGVLWGWGSLKATVEPTGDEIVDKIWGIYYTPVRVAGEGRFLSLGIALDGFNGYYVIDADGNLCVWCGENDEGTKVSVPTKIWTNKKFSSVVSSRGHLLALDAEGKLYTRGNNNYGQLGIGMKGENLFLLSVWNEIMSDKSFTYIYANGTQSFAIDTEGRLWAWGDNHSGHLNGILNYQVTLKKLSLK